MDLIATLSDLLADDAVVLALVAMAGAAALALLAFSLLQSRLHVRRRAAEGLVAAAGSRSAAAGILQRCRQDARRNPGILTRSIRNGLRVTAR